ncbi:MAG TPA: DUF308 domain-containing protein [Puia sp.]|nr:DUF308 domain-containing protein [Puia sp.]
MQPNAKKTSTWWLLAIIGLLFLGVGLFAFIDPLSSYMKLVKFTGIGLILNGGLLMVMSALNTRYPRERIWMQAESILHMLFGIFFLFNPLLAFIALPYFIGGWILLVGILKTLAALALRTTVRGWLFILATGVLCIVFGVLMIYSPFVRANGITVLIGSFGVIMGALYIIDSFRYRKMKETLDMML